MHPHHSKTKLTQIPTAINNEDRAYFTPVVDLLHVIVARLLLLTSACCHHGVLVYVIVARLLLLTSACCHHGVLVYVIVARLLLLTSACCHHGVLVYVIVARLLLLTSACCRHGVLVYVIVARLLLLTSACCHHGVLVYVIVARLLLLTSACCHHGVLRSIGWWTISVWYSPNSNSMLQVFTKCFTANLGLHMNKVDHMVNVVKRFFPFTDAQFELIVHRPWVKHFTMISTVSDNTAHNIEHREMKILLT